MCWQPDDWKRAHPGLPAIFDIPGLTIDAVCPDWMHTKHLGADQYLFGSVLMMMCHQMIPRSPEANLAMIWAELKAATKGSGGYSEIRMNMCCPDSSHFPCLKGKAGEVRKLVAPY